MCSRAMQSLSLLLATRIARRVLQQTAYLAPDMSAPTPTSNSLLAEHFGWTPLAFVDDVINSISELMYGTIKTIDDYLLSLPPEDLGFVPPPGVIPETDGDGNVVLSESEITEIESGLHKLQTLMENALDKNFDRFELYVLRNLLAVRPDQVPWIRLEHHKSVGFATTAELLSSDSPIPAEQAQLRFRELRQKLRASYHLNHTLLRQKASNERALAGLRALVDSTEASPLTASETTLSSILAGSGSMGENAGFATAQLHLIRSLVAELKPMYEDLHASEGRGGTRGARTEDERKQYIESMTRRHMEVSRKMRLNAHGEVVGGDYESGGVMRGSEEVQKLEEVLGKLGKAHSA